MISKRLTLYIVILLGAIAVASLVMTLRLTLEVAEIKIAIPLIPFSQNVFNSWGYWIWWNKAILLLFQSGMFISVFSFVTIVAGSLTIFAFVKWKGEKFASQFL